MPAQGVARGPETGDSRFPGISRQEQGRKVKAGDKLTALTEDPERGCAGKGGY